MVNVLMSRSSMLIDSKISNALNDILKTDMKVVVVGFSFFGELTKSQYFLMYDEKSEYQIKIKELFLNYGITDVEWLYYYDQTSDAMIELINNADVLYFPGGAPDLMYQRIIEKDILSSVKSFDKIIIGSSAGAMIQLADYHISIDNEYSKFSEELGLGYLKDFFIEVHFRRRKKQRSSMRYMRKKYLKPVYVIPDNGAIIVKQNQVSCYGDAKLFFNKRGIVK